MRFGTYISLWFEVDKYGSLGSHIRIDIDIFSLIIMVIIMFDVYDRTENQSLQYKLFIALLFSNMALLVLEMLG